MAFIRRRAPARPSPLPRRLKFGCVFPESVKVQHAAKFFARLLNLRRTPTSERTHRCVRFDYVFPVFEIVTGICDEKNSLSLVCLPPSSQPVAARPNARL
jgi:hypothetical protein